MIDFDDINDSTLFFAEVKGVKPLQQNHIIPTKPKRKKPTEAQLARQQAALQNTEPQSRYLTLDNAPMLDANATLHFRRNGIQDSVYKKLRLGKYPIQAHLDLHNFTLDQARNEVLRFIGKCLKLEIRSVIIIHGKGAYQKTPALIKSYLVASLKEMNEVLCFHSAQPYHGGTGAVYVLLKNKNLFEHKPKRF